MLLYPEEYDRFAELVRQAVILEVLERVLVLDCARVGQLPVKMQRPLKRLWMKTLGRVQEDLAGCRRELNRCGGKIIAVRQLPDAREVQAKFRGFLYTQFYVNEIIRNECEEILWNYWSGSGKSSRQQSFHEGSH
ncbi:hypothetical protein GCM10011571_21590 [Marinithermofilum abyssi]|uniref:Uncharacterized protein n=1 Tax=Marinithermofilum abyssi TaxID=1571185 RepID=A0A8J2VFD5_9BACL|nr:hypothetical protein [Marinithermofilum abyssi]GGE19347.1 hypothetical protein GCM10011571_21590 [Marinithermofilum abyssi]